MSEQQRAMVLERDQVYQTNARCLLRRWQQHKIDEPTFSRVKGWLEERAMFRHGKEATSTLVLRRRVR